MTWKRRNKDEDPKNGASIPTNKWSEQQKVDRSKNKGIITSCSS